MRYITVFILSLIFWLLLTFSFTLPNLIVGSVLLFYALQFLPVTILRMLVNSLQPNRYFWFIVYLLIFIWECIKANFDVAYRVIHPSMPIKPGIVKVKTTLKSDFAKDVAGKFNHNDTGYNYR